MLLKLLLLIGFKLLDVVSEVELVVTVGELLIRIGPLMMFILLFILVVVFRLLHGIDMFPLFGTLFVEFVLLNLLMLPRFETEVDVIREETI